MLVYRQLKFNLSSKYTAPQIYQFILHLNEYDLSKTSDPGLHYLTPLSNWSSFLFFPMPLHQSHLTDIVSIKVIFLVFLSHIYTQTNYNFYSPYISLNSLPLSAIISQILRVPPEHFKRFPAHKNWINGDLKHCSLASIWSLTMQNMNFSTNVEVGSKVKTNYKTFKSL